VLWRSAAAELKAGMEQITYGLFYSWVNMWVAVKSVGFLVNTCQSEGFKDEYCRHYKALYKCPVYAYAVDFWMSQGCIPTPE